MNQIVVLVTTKDNEEARKMAQVLVGEKWAACVNIVKDVRSVYRWEGKVCDESESLLIIKTVQEKFEGLQKSVTFLHSYSVPEIIALPIVAGSQPYLDWVLDQMSDGA